MISMIKDARIDKGLTQRQAAKLIGITPEYYSNLECSRYVPSISSVGDRIAEVLGLDKDDLALEFFKLGREKKRKKE